MWKLGSKVLLPDNTPAEIFGSSNGKAVCMVTEITLRNGVLDPESVQHSMVEVEEKKLRPLPVSPMLQGILDLFGEGG